MNVSRLNEEVLQTVKSQETAEESRFVQKHTEQNSQILKATGTLADESSYAATNPPQNKETTAQDLEKLQQAPSRDEVYSVFSTKQRIWIVFIASIAGFVSPLSGNIYLPALNPLSRDFHVSSELINITLTSYLIMQGIAPTMMGDLADMAGRRPVYILCFTIYIGANIGLALSQNYASLLVLRCLQSSGSSGTIALANAVVADVTTSSERGTFMGYAQSGAMIGPAIGPVLGGVLSQYLGWRAIFWFLVILAGSVLALILVSLPETGRNVVGNGSVPPPVAYLSLINYLHYRKDAKNSNALERTRSAEDAQNAKRELARKRRIRFPNPLKAVHIVMEKDAGILLIFNALIFTSFYCVTASMPVLFARQYHFNDLKVGLSYLPYGFGCVVASIGNGRVLDWNYRRVAKQHGLSIDKKRGENMRFFPIEQARLQVAFPLLMMAIANNIALGWVIDKAVHYAAALVLLFTMGCFSYGAFNVANVLLVDLFIKTPATATSANNLCRCLMAAGGSALVIQMINAMGVGWCYTLIGLVLLCLSPAYYVLLRWGPRWREERFARWEREEAMKTERAAGREKAVVEDSAIRLGNERQESFESELKDKEANA